MEGFFPFSEILKTRHDFRESFVSFACRQTEPQMHRHNHQQKDVPSSCKPFLLTTKEKKTAKPVSVSPYNALCWCKLALPEGLLLNTKTRVSRESRRSKLDACNIHLLLNPTLRKSRLAAAQTGSYQIKDQQPLLRTPGSSVWQIGLSPSTFPFIVVILIIPAINQVHGHNKVWIRKLAAPFQFVLSFPAYLNWCYRPTS